MSVENSGGVLFSTMWMGNPKKHSSSSHSQGKLRTALIIKVIINSLQTVLWWHRDDVSLCPLRLGSLALRVVFLRNLEILFLFPLLFIYFLCWRATKKRQASYFSPEILHTLARTVCWDDDADKAG